MSEEWQKLEENAAAVISKAMKELNRLRWAKATPADRKRQGKLLAAGRKRKRIRRGK